MTWDCVTFLVACDQVMCSSTTVVQQWNQKKTWYSRFGCLRHETHSQLCLGELWIILIEWQYISKCIFQLHFEHFEHHVYTYTIYLVESTCGAWCQNQTVTQGQNPLTIKRYVLQYHLFSWERKPIIQIPMRNISKTYSRHIHSTFKTDSKLVIQQLVPVWMTICATCGTCWTTGPWSTCVWVWLLNHSIQRYTKVLRCFPLKSERNWKISNARVQPSHTTPHYNGSTLSARRICRNWLRHLNLRIA